jgi:hypothetical protein
LFKMVDGDVHCRQFNLAALEFDQCHSTYTKPR